MSYFVREIFSAHPKANTSILVIGVVGLCAAAFSLAAALPVHYLRFDEVRDLISAMIDAGAPDVPSSEVTDGASWDRWIAVRDREIRSRIDRGIEDSISNLVLFGTSYTTLPPIPSANDAADSSGKLSPAARARVRALAQATAASPKNERVAFAQQFLLKHKVGPAAAEAYLSVNLQRLVLDEREFDRKQQAAQRTGDAADLILTRATIYKDRGLSFDTSLEPDFAFETMLRQMVAKGELAPGGVKKIAVMGPGLDFADKRLGLDFYPLQTIQPFAIMESALRLRLADSKNLRVVAFDLNPAVLAHIDRIAQQGRLGRPYVVQLPNDRRNEWTPDLLAYWSHFGELLGSPAEPINPPGSLRGVEMRAVAISPEFARSVSGQDLNMVAQQVDLLPGERFDLVIASNIFVYYNFFEQALAMQNISHMMNPGGVFLVNQILSNQHPDALKLVDQCSVDFNAKGVFGDNVVAYQQQK